jgi:hypothetical protein
VGEKVGALATQNVKMSKCSKAQQAVIFSVENKKISGFCVFRVELYEYVVTRRAGSIKEAAEITSLDQANKWKNTIWKIKKRPNHSGDICLPFLLALNKKTLRVNRYMYNYFQY